MNNLSLSPAKYDEKQLEHWQKEAINNLDINDFYNFAGNKVLDIVTNHKEDFFDLIKHNILFPIDIEHWANNIFNKIDYNLEKLELVTNLLENKVKDFYNKCIEIINTDGSDYKNLCNKLKENLNIKGKYLFMPLRIAITGEPHGPELDKIFNILSDEKIVNKFQDILAKL